MARKSTPAVETLATPDTIEETALTPETIIGEAPVKRRSGRKPEPGNRSALGVSVGIKLYPEELDLVTTAFPGATNAAAVLEVVKMFLSDTDLVAMAAEVADLRETVTALRLENDRLRLKIAKAVDALALAE